MNLNKPRSLERKRESRNTHVHICLIEFKYSYLGKSMRKGRNNHLFNKLCGTTDIHMRKNKPSHLPLTAEKKLP